MAGVSALHQAMALQASPVLAAAMREQPLPDDVLTLVKIAAGDEVATSDAAAVLRARPARLQEAAALYIQHVVFAPSADQYRILAARRDAPHAELRDHVAWLMKWLHPDHADNERDSVFAHRVTAAWNALKTPEKRAAYDLAFPPMGSGRRTPSGRRRAVVRVARGAPLIPRLDAAASRRRKLRLAAYAVAAAIAVAMIFAVWPGLLPASSGATTPVVAADGN